VLIAESYQGDNMALGFAENDQHQPFTVFYKFTHEYDMTVSMSCHRRWHAMRISLTTTSFHVVKGHRRSILMGTRLITSSLHIILRPPHTTLQWGQVWQPHRSTLLKVTAEVSILMRASFWLPHSLHVVKVTTWIRINLATTLLHVLVITKNSILMMILQYRAPP
jgi:hypothetical protein